MGEEVLFFLIPVMVVGLMAGLVSIIAQWKLYTKASKPGWAILIPIYNIYVLLQIANRPTWWLVFYLLPPILVFPTQFIFGEESNIFRSAVMLGGILSLAIVVVQFLVSLSLAKVFGRSRLFGIVFLWLFSVIGYLIIGLGKSKYQAASNAPTPPANPGPPAASAPANPV